MLKINFSRVSLKFLKSLPSKQKHQCALKIQDLRKNPTSQDVKKLKGVPYFRCACGEYRIIFDIQNETLQIILIEKRNDGRVYKKMNRLT
jgi:mRNA interferase RelE/StbE